MEKQILKAVEEAYRKGLREGNAIKDIKPYLVTSQVVAHDLVNKFCKAHVIKLVCSCVEAQGEEIGWIQKRHCNRCDKVIEQAVR